MKSCPNDATLVAFVELDLPDPRRSDVIEHLDGCEDCRRTVAVVAEGWEGRESVVEDQRVVGRYRIVGTLGEGGMGVVHRAFDPRLGREVALKLSRRELGAQEGLRRQRDEARAMAQLQHPNVVQVYDVGWCEDGLYVAAEIVDGQTLRQWLRAERTVAEIVQVFELAGRGLAAVHDRGLVHRDFKPDNVLIDAAGRVKVADFGLACVAHARADSGTTLDASGPGLSATHRTETGLVVGTPAYMAPEQFQGHTTDARADQFAFCVALFEACAGTRPFRGRSIEELRRAVVRGDRAPIPRGAMPRHVERLVDRGLRPDPDSRFPSMAALLDALVPQRTTWRPMAAGLGGLLIAASLAVPTDRSPSCVDDDPTRALWSPARASNVERRLTERGMPAVGASRLVDELDDKVVALRQRYLGTCTADAQEAPSPTDTRRRCIRGSIRELAAGLDLLEAPRAPSAGQWDLVSGIPNGSECEEGPPALQVSTELAQARALGRLGLRLEAIERYEAIRSRAQEAGDATTESVVLREVAGQYDVNSQFEEAIDAARAGYFKARQAGEAREAARAALLVAEYQAERAGRPEEAERWLRHALPLVGDDGALQGQVALARATIAVARDDFVSARKHAARAVERISEEHPLSRSNALLRLGQAEVRSGRPDVGLEHMDEAVAVLRRSLGDHAPRVALGRGSLGLAKVHNLDVEGGEAECREALESLSAALGPRDPHLRSVHVCIGVALMDQAKNEEAGRHFEVARTLEVATSGAHHVNVGIIENNLALAALNSGRLEDALAHHDEAVAIVSAQDPPRPTWMARTLKMRARSRMHAAQAEAALEDAQRAYQLATEALPAPAVTTYAQTHCLAAVEARVDSSVPCATLEQLLTERDAEMDERQMVHALGSLESGDDGRAAAVIDTLLSGTPGPARVVELHIAATLADRLRRRGHPRLARRIVDHALKHYVPHTSAPGPRRDHIEALRRRLVGDESGFRM